MSEMALQLIRQAKAEGWKTLDLGNTGIVGEVPAEIWELTELEELILSERWFEWIDGEYTGKKSKNTGPKNNISSLADYPPPLKEVVGTNGSTFITIPRLIDLKKLVLGDTKIDSIRPLYQLDNLQQLYLQNTQVADLRPIAHLYMLQLLDLGASHVTDIKPLGNLFRLEILNLSGTNVEVIQPLAQLHKLIKLDLGRTKVADIQPLANLSNLQYLGLAFTQGKDIQPLAQLSNLQSLSLDGTQVADIQTLVNLSNLQSLSLDGTQVADIQPLAKLSNLQVLDLSSTQVADIQPLANLSNLRELYLSDTEVANIKPLTNLSKLRELALSDTQVADIRPLANLSDLQGLYLNDTQVADIQPLSELNNLQIINLHHTLITYIHPLANLSKLKLLTLIRTQVADIQPLKSQLENGLVIGLAVCPLSNPPYEIAIQGNDAILAYWHRRDFDGELPLNEAKVILLGQGAAGKTSLVRHFFRERFSKKQLQTNGILIRKKQVVMGKEKEAVLVRFWDFGGQEVMHATHKFFLTRRATYLIVLDARKDDKEVEYWLEHVRLYGGDSPVLIAINKIDENPSFALNEAGLKNKYGEQIKGIYKISCSKKTGIKELEKALYAEIATSEDTHTPMPKSWRLIKDEMEALSEDYVGYDRFRGVCRQHDIDEVEEQDTLLTLLNNLGIALNFDALKVYNRAVLKPEWLTQAVYRIINAHQTAEQFGSFHAGEVGKLLDDRKYGKDKVDPGKYPPETYEFIGEVMRIFELCYPLVPNKQGRAYMIPELLKVEENDGGFVFDGCTRLTISYPSFLPPSVFPRFIVQMHPWLVKEHCWRTGARLSYPQFGAEGLVKLDRFERKIEVWTSGPAQGGRKLMEFIRDTFLNIHSDFEELPVKELVPLGNGEFVSYSELVGYDKGNRPTFYSGVLEREFSVKQLLGEIESEERRKRGQPVQIFLSYARKDKTFRQAFETHITLLKRAGRVKIWVDERMDADRKLDDALDKAIHDAHIMVCLLSPDYLQSEYCHDFEFQRGLALEVEDQLSLVLVQVRTNGWKKHPEMAKKLVVPDRPISRMDDADEGWLEVVERLEPIIEKWHQRINSGRPPYDSIVVQGKLR